MRDDAAAIARATEISHGIEVEVWCGARASPSSRDAGSRTADGTRWFYLGAVEALPALDPADRLSRRTSNPGSRAMLTAIRRASSGVSTLACIASIGWARRRRRAIGRWRLVRHSRRDSVGLPWGRDRRGLSWQIISMIHGQRRQRRWLTAAPTDRAAGRVGRHWVSRSAVLLTGRLPNGLCRVLISANALIFLVPAGIEP